MPFKQRCFFAISYIVPGPYVISVTEEEYPVPLTGFLMKLISFFNGRLQLAIPSAKADVKDFEKVGYS